MDIPPLSTEDNNPNINNLKNEEVCIECQGFSLFYGENQALF